MLYFDTNPNVDFYLYVGTNLGFCLGTDAYLDTNLDDLGFGKNTDENPGTDPSIGLGITTPFKFNASTGAELGIGDVGSCIDENLGTVLYDNLGINTAFDFTINHRFDTSVENDEHSQALTERHIQTIFNWSQANL